MGQKAKISIPPKVLNHQKKTLPPKKDINQGVYSSGVNIKGFFGSPTSPRLVRGHPHGGLGIFRLQLQLHLAVDTNPTATAPTGVFQHLCSVVQVQTDVPLFIKLCCFTLSNAIVPRDAPIPDSYITMSWLCWLRSP